MSSPVGKCSHTDLTSMPNTKCTDKLIEAMCMKTYLLSTQRVFSKNERILFSQIQGQFGSIVLGLAGLRHGCNQLPRTRQEVCVQSFLLNCQESTSELYTLIERGYQEDLFRTVCNLSKSSYINRDDIDNVRLGHKFSQTNICPIQDMLITFSDKCLSVNWSKILLAISNLRAISVNSQEFIKVGQENAQRIVLTLQYSCLMHSNNSLLRPTPFSISDRDFCKLACLCTLSHGFCPLDISLNPPANLDYLSQLWSRLQPTRPLYQKAPSPAIEPESHLHHPNEEPLSMNDQEKLSLLAQKSTCVYFLFKSTN